jgi:hypothetical protein
MKKADVSKKTKSPVDSKQSPQKAGPVELSLADMKKVSGGLPKGGWAAEKTTK